jgi:uncharacterized protein
VKPFIKNLEATVKEKMSPLEGTAHSYEHVDRVVKIAAFLAEKEGADLELVQVAAILHDVGWVVGQPHNETGARLAGEILKEIKYSPRKIEKVLKIVLHHPMDFRGKLETLEEKIVWDADKIDLLGAVGIARGFHWEGKRSFESAVKLAFRVFTPIYDSLNTSTAKQIAEKRQKETMSFLSALEKELSLADLAIG